MNDNNRSFTSLTVIFCLACILANCMVVKTEEQNNETPESLFQQAEQISSTNVDRAIELYQRALELNPSVDVAHDIWVSLSNIYASSGNIRQAVDYFIKIAEYRRNKKMTGVEQIYFNIGLAYSQMNDWTNALVYFEKALDVNPNFVSAIVKCAYIYNLQGKSDKVVLYLQQAIKLQPGNVNTYLYLGDTLNNLKRWDESATVYQKGLQVQPNHPELHLAFANTLNNLGLLPQAYKHYKKAVEVGNGFPPSLAGLLSIKRELALWDDWNNLVNNMMQSCKNLIKQGQNSIISPYNALYLPISPQDQMDIATNYAKGVFRVKQSVENRLTENPQEEKSVIHIGYISTRFRKYAGAQLMLRIFGLHDRSKFKVFSYSHGPDDQGGSLEREIIKNTSDVFRDLYHMDNLQAAQIIKNDNIDILIDCNGIHDENSLEILVFRPAPIQVTYLGFPGTTGASGIFDYIITDRFVTPPELARYFVEKPAYMPQSFFPYDHLTAVSNATLTREQYGLPESSFVYCSFNRLNKIEPDAFGSWMRVMKRVDNSVMWLFSGEKHEAEQNLLNEAQKQGVNGSRIVFARKAPKPEHLARQKLCDLFLDTFYYDAHTTAADALWVGLPLLTLPGENFASRVAGSLLKAAGVGDEMIASSKQDYEAKAAEYATSKSDVLKQVREKLETKQHHLFNGPQYVRELEELYEKLWKDHQGHEDHVHDEL